MNFLEVSNCRKVFSGLVALSDVSISVGEREILGLIGPNGSGKTTLFNIISGFHSPEKGSIHFDGKRINELKAYQISRRGISRTFQIPRPFGNISVFQNVLVGTAVQTGNFSQARQTALELLDFTTLKEKRERLANSLPIADRKRLEIAKALSTNPKLLLLDEVMAGLTPTEITKMIDLIRRINGKGITLIVIEHNMQAVMSICSRIVVLNYGEKIADGMPQDVVRNEKVIKAYLGDEYVLYRNS